MSIPNEPKALPQKLKNLKDKIEDMKEEYYESIKGKKTNEES